MKGFTIKGIKIKEFNCKHKKTGTNSNFALGSNETPKHQKASLIFWKI
jgi:hypothetical protein